jgi:hypothetical protein
MTISKGNIDRIKFRENLIRWLSWMKTRRKAFSQNLKNQGKAQRSFDNSSQSVGRHKAKSTSQCVAP